MIPIRLELKNFLSYGECHGPLSLEGIRVACLSGPNGHGKSALLDAMVWALWGEPRGGTRAGDDLIREGASEMEVALEFEMDGARYRVTRRRSIRANGRATSGGTSRLGTTELHFEGSDGEGWRPLAEGTGAQTQRAIDRLLRMSHDTFVHASFIQQGKADAFMRMTPQQRKSVLGEILGLARFDELSEAARDAGRQAKNEADRFQTLLHQIDRELEKRDAYQKQLEEAESAEQEASAAAARLTEERTQLLSDVERLVGVEQQAARARDQLADGRQQLLGIDRQIGELTERVSDAARLVEHAEEIECQFAAHQQLEDEERALASLFDGWHALQDQLHTIEAGIERERVRMQAETVAAQQREKEGEARLAEIPEVETRVQQLRGEVAELEKVQLIVAQAQDDANRANERLAALRQAGERLRLDDDQVGQRITMLGQSDECPLCGQALGEDGLAAAQARLQHERQSVQRQLAETRSAYAAQQAAVRAAQGRVQEHQGRLEKRNAIERDLGDLEARLRAADQHRSALEEARLIVEQLISTLEADDFAADLRGQLAPLQAAIAANGYDADRHRLVRQQRDELQSAPQRHAALQAAQATLESAQVHREGLKAQKQSTESSVADLAGQADRLAAEAAGLVEGRRALKAKEDELQAAAEAARHASRKLGEARQMVAWLDQQAAERGDVLVKRDAAMADRSLFEQLAEAFGKNGIQEMVIDHALPEIQDSANGLLARLTEGRMRVTLDTQRAGRGGSVISTLDVNVSDELGTRPYELFSGGERFRIDFAIRIALSRLLASRANAPLQMLAIDEGFGSQDREGCDRLVEAIKAIQDDFERILVITHLDELKDAFPVRIEVTKTHLGSTFAIT